MSGRSLRRCAVTGLILTFGLLPLSAAHAAPAAGQTATVSQWVRAWGLSLLQAFQQTVGNRPKDVAENAQDEDSIQGPTDPHDGVGIDPNGRPRR